MKQVLATRGLHERRDLKLLLKVVCRSEWHPDSGRYNCETQQAGPHYMSKNRDARRGLDRATVCVVG